MVVEILSKSSEMNVESARIGMLLLRGGVAEFSAGTVLKPDQYRFMRIQRG